MMTTFEAIRQRLESELKLDPVSEDFAKHLDLKDPLRSVKSEFHYPKLSDLPKTDPKLCPDLSKDSIYLEGNSMGLQPKRLANVMADKLDKWARLGSHFRMQKKESYMYDEETGTLVAQIVGASADEVSIMGSLTINLHILMLAFYRPTARRFKVLCEAKPFPSDFYAFESQVRLHGLEPEEVIVKLHPREDEHCLRTEDIVEAIRVYGSELALVCLPGIQFYTGQFFDIPAITRAAQAVGAFAGWDLAHAVGNVELALHDWAVDFAVWCHYKYMCGGPGSVGGAFVHAKHNGKVTPALHGWWGHDLSTRFQMTNEMALTPGAHGFRISCPNPIALAPVLTGAEVLLEVGMNRLRAKSRLLTGYLEFLLARTFPPGQRGLEIISPSDPEQRGAQLSLRFPTEAGSVNNELLRRGVSCDVREPDVIRVSPHPIYNSFEEVFLFVQHLRDILAASSDRAE